MKKNIISFFVTFFALFILYIINGFIFGDSSILYSDSRSQYFQGFIYLKDLLLNHSFYSFKVGLGSSMVSTYAYYLSSIYNLLVLFITNDKLELFLVITSLIKISLCSVTMNMYLNYNFQSKYSIAFAISYALSFYIIVNFFQFMWLDIYLLAPLLFLGIDKLIKEDKYLLYGIILFIILISNYYLGYMCCIFSIIYFFYKYLLLEKNPKKIFTFFIVSILFGLMTMFLHFPNLLEIIKINRNFDSSHFFNFDIAGILSKIMIGSNVKLGIINPHHPFLYVGIFNLILLIGFFINKKIDYKEKKFSAFIILLLLFSLIYVPLNNFWHAFSKPIGYNFRYMFLFNIFFIYLCYKSFLNIQFLTKKEFLIIIIIFIFLCIVVYFRNIINPLYIIINILMFLIFIIVFNNFNKINSLFIVLVVAELFFNGYTVLRQFKYVSKDYLKNLYNEKINILNNINDDYFYRMEFLNHFGFNDPLHFNYNGLSGWYSSVHFNSNFYNKIGINSSSNFISYNNFLLLDSLFSIKYVSSTQKLNHYDLIATNLVSIYDNEFYGFDFQDNFLYKNPYSLSLGYMVSENSKNNLKCNSVFDCQNKLINNLTDTSEDVYKLIDLNDQIEKLNQEIYIFPIIKENNENKKNSLCIDNSCYHYYKNKNLNLIYNNNDYQINIKKENIDKIDSAIFNYDVFLNKYNILKNNQLNITSFKDNHIVGNINVDNNKVLFLSIPYDDCFKILVDNKEVEYYKLLDNFIGVDLDSGYHNIEIIYKINGLKTGIIISLISLIAFLFVRKYI